MVWYELVGGGGDRDGNLPASNDDAEDAGGDMAWSGELKNLPSDVDRALWQGELIPALPPNVRFKADHVKVTQDVPFCLGRHFVVSENVRLCIEALAPGQAQFFPIAMTYYNKPIPDLQPYWVMNVLPVVSCRVALPPVMRTIQTPQGPRERSETPHAIDTSLIPAHLHLLRVQESRNTVLISERLRTALREAGVTGIAYFDIKQI